MRLPIAASLLCLSGVAAANDQGPLEIRNLRSISAPFLRIDPRPEVLQKGERTLSIGYSVANDIRKLYAGGSLAVDEDYEIDRLLFRYRTGIGHEMDVTFDVPLLYRSGGFLDPIVSGWHDLVLNGFPSPRDDAPYGVSRVSVPGSPAFGSAFGIGDLSVAVSRRFGSRWTGTFAAKLPTGSDSDLIGSGGFDAGIAAQYRAQVAPKWSLYAQIGLIAQGRATTLDSARGLVHQEALAVVWSPNSRDSWIAQWQGEESATVTGVRASDAPHRQISFGFHRRIASNQNLELFFSEDHDFLNYPKGLTGVAPDFTAGVRWTRRF